MPVVEVSCPNCGAKLKAPDNMAGKKAKCRKCTKTFRLPGTPVAESAGDADVPLADLIETSPPPPPAKTAGPLPSADPFDFSDPPDPPKPAPAKPQAAPAKPPATPAPAKPVAPSKPQAAAPAPAKPQAVAPAKPPATKPDSPKAPKTAEPPPPAPPPPPEPAPAANPFAFDAPEAAPDDPFAFGTEPAPPTKGKAKEKEKAKSKPREEAEPPSKKGRAAEENEAAPRKKAKTRDDEDEADEDEKPAKGKAKTRAEEPYNPFANYSADPGPAAEPEVTWNKPSRDEGETETEDEPEKPRYRRPDELPDTTRRTLFLTGAVGAVALALGILALVVYIKANRPPPDPEVKKDDKKDEPPPVPPDPVRPEPPKGDGPKVDPKGKDKVDPPKIDPKGKDKVDPKVDPPKVDPKVDPKMDPKVDPPKVDPVRPKDPGPKRDRTISGVQGVRPFTVGMPPAKPELTEKPRIQLAVGAPVTSVKRVFPRLSKDTDTGVLVRTGAGERLAIESYGAVGNLVPGARIEYDGDGSPDPIADMYAPAENGRFLAAVGGKLYVWTLTDRKKLADGLDPYADKPDHAKAGLAAAFLTPDPNQVVTVSTAGAVHLYDLRDRKAVSEFLPPYGAPGRVALGLSVAKAEGNGSIVLALGGVIYQLEAKPGLKELRKFDFGADVNRSLGLAVSGTPGRILYAFEAAPDKNGKIDKLVMGLSLGTMARPVFCQVPADLGEPKGALWANTDFGGVVVEKGVLWFDDHENRFHPLALTQPPAPGLFAGDEFYFWYVVPNAKDATKSAVVAISAPPDGKFQANFPAQPLPTYRIDATGLSR